MRIDLELRAHWVKENTYLSINWLESVELNEQLNLVNISLKSDKIKK